MSQDFVRLAGKILKGKPVYKTPACIEFAGAQVAKDEDEISITLDHMALVRRFSP